VVLGGHAPQCTDPHHPPGRLVAPGRGVGGGRHGVRAFSVLAEGRCVGAAFFRAEVFRRGAEVEGFCARALPRSAGVF
jgi:hypothetical protein